jgi:hypothetical protein
VAVEIEARDAAVARVCTLLRTLANQTTGQKQPALASAAWFDPALRAARAAGPLPRYGEDAWSYRLRSWPKVLDATELPERLRPAAAAFPGTYGQPVAAFALLIHRDKYATEFGAQAVRFIARQTRLALEAELCDFARRALRRVPGRHTTELPGKATTLLDVVEELNALILEGEPFDTLCTAVVDHVETTLARIARLYTLEVEARGRKILEPRYSLGRVAFRAAGALVTAHPEERFEPEDVAVVVAAACWGDPPAHLKKLIENEARHWATEPVTDAVLRRILLDAHAGRRQRMSHRDRRDS